MQDAVPLRRRRIRIRLWFLLLALAVAGAAAGAGTGLYVWLRGGDEDSVRIVTAVQFPYPERWQESSLSDADRSAGILLSLERRNPEATFLARTVIARLAADFDINTLADETEAALSSEIENFDLVSKSVSTVGPYDAVRIYYRQAGDTPSEEFQSLMVIVPTSAQTFYLTFRAETDDFRRIESDGLEIVETFVTYVASAP
jgi:hypothetical protein